MRWYMYMTFYRTHFVFLSPHKKPGKAKTHEKKRFLHCCDFSPIFFPVIQKCI